MANYGSIYPSFWTGETGRALRKEGVEAQLVALYLLSNGHSNPLGIYYLPKILISHETSLSEQGASKGLQRGIQIGFCAYDHVSEVVFIPRMAIYQIGNELKAGDKRVKWINDTYNALPNNPFLYAFWEQYGSKFHIEKPRGLEGAWKGLQCPINAPPKPTHTLTHTLTLSQEEKEAPVQEAKKRTSEITYPDWLDLELWKDFKEYRQGLPKSKFTAKAEKLCLGDLSALIEIHGLEYQREIIEGTIKSCKWLTFYPPKKNGNGKSNKIDKTMEVFARRERERQEQEQTAEDGQAAGSRPDTDASDYILPS